MKTLTLREREFQFAPNKVFGSGGQDLDMPFADSMLCHPLRKSTFALCSLGRHSRPYNLGWRV